MNSSLLPSQNLQNRAVNQGHQFRASADMASLQATSNLNATSRPHSDLMHKVIETDSAEVDQAADQWLAEIDQCENLLEEMAGATTDQDFKAELTAIEEWFRVLSEAERTASLYALIQQATRVQILFFLETLQEMLQKYPTPASLRSFKNFNSSSSSNKNSRQNVRELGAKDIDRSASGDAHWQHHNKATSNVTISRAAGLEASEINAMFPDAVSAIAKRKAELSTHIENSGNANTTSQVLISSPYLPQDLKHAANSLSSTRQNFALHPNLSGQHVENHVGAAPSLAQTARMALGGMAGPSLWNQNEVHTNPQNINPVEPPINAPLLSPYNMGNASWASLSSTPMRSKFSQKPTAIQAELVANATAMKLAALSTVNNRIALDDVRKYHRRPKAKENDGPTSPNPSTIPPNSIQRPDIKEHTSSRLSYPDGFAETAAADSHMPRNSNVKREIVENCNSEINKELDGRTHHDSLVSSSAGDHIKAFGAKMSSDTNESLTPERKQRPPFGNRQSSKNADEALNLHLIKDVPAWLRSLRLHKYTDNLKDYGWTDLIKFDDAKLEENGVNALGARRKLLKVFEQARDAEKTGHL